MNKKFYLLGGNGAPNFGDELIAKAWMNQITKNIQDSEIILDCNSIKTPNNFFELDKIGVKNISGLKIFCNTVIRKKVYPITDKSDRFLHALEYGVKFFKKGHYKKHRGLVDALSSIEDANSFHIFGGGYISTTINPEAAFHIGFASAAHKEFKIKVFGTGLGITPLDLEASRSKLLANALSDFEIFECRDSYGFKKLKELTGESTNIINGLDDTYLANFSPVNDKTKGKSLHLSFTHKELSGRMNRLHHEILRIQENYESIYYWDCAPRLVDENMEILHKLIPRMIKISCKQLVFNPIPVNLGDHMITQRFHPHLIAARLGAVGFFVQESKYYKDKHQSVVDLGSGFCEYNPDIVLNQDGCNTNHIIAKDQDNMDQKSKVFDICYGTYKCR